MKTIYNVYVPIESQEQADRMKQICIDYKLPYWNEFIAFRFTKNKNKFGIQSGGKFHLYYTNYNDKTQVTESEFLELVKMLNKC